MKKVLLFLGLVLSMLTVCAEENVLQTIEIVPVKDTYNIVLVADKPVDVKKNVEAPNKVNLNLKGIRASKTLNTVYNNVANVDTVMVEQNGNGLNIFFQAENASDANVTFDAIMPIAQPKQAQKTIKLSHPVDSYAPIYEQEFSQSKTSTFFNNLTKNKAFDGIKENIDEDTASDILNKCFSFGLLALLGYFIVRIFKRKEPEMKIGLGNSLTEREIEMYKNSPISSYNTTVDRPFTTVNYGINAYQKETRNPYESEPVSYHNPKLRNYTSQPIQQTQQAQTQTAVKQAIKQVVKKHTTPVNTAPVNQSNPNIDNLKFLETMTAIYEKSGRHDLAKGLQASLSKNNK